MWEAIPLFLAAGFSVYTDIREKKIKNYITFPLMTAGLLYNVVIDGFDGLVFSMTGLLVAGIITIIMSFMKGFGMGDVKLFMGIGAFMGYRFAIETLVYSIFSAVVISIIIHPKKFISGIENICKSLKHIAFFHTLPTLKEQGSAMTIAYAVHIFIGLICSYLIGGAWIWGL